MISGEKLPDCHTHQKKLILLAIGSYMHLCTCVFGAYRLSTYLKSTWKLNTQLHIPCMSIGSQPYLILFK